MQKVGWALLIAGGAVVAGYWAYYVILEVFESVPPLLRAAVLGIAVGLVMLFGAAVRDRLSERKNERL